jgi:hypothetical protein
MIITSGGAWLKLNKIESDVSLIKFYEMSLAMIYQTVKRNAHGEASG